MARKPVLSLGAPRAAARGLSISSPVRPRYPSSPAVSHSIAPIQSKAPQTDPAQPISPHSSSPTSPNLDSASKPFHSQKQPASVKIRFRPSTKHQHKHHQTSQPKNDTPPPPVPELAISTVPSLPVYHKSPPAASPQPIQTKPPQSRNTPSSSHQTSGTTSSLQQALKVYSHLAKSRKSRPYHLHLHLHI